MERLRHGRMAYLAVVGAAILWTTGSAGAQSGHPDLSGTYDAATMTPLERPAQFGGRLVMTPEEAAAVENQEAQRQEQGAEPSQGDRTAPPVGGDQSATKSYLERLFRSGGGTVGGYNLFWISPGTHFAIVNGEKRTSIVVDPADGHVPPESQEARARNQRILAQRVSPEAAEGAGGGPSSVYDDPEARPLAERCLLGFGSTSGPPTLPNYWYNNLKQIVQTRDSVMILNEMVHDARIVRMNAEHLPPSVRRWNGDSVGRWDGDALVIDTTNFTDKTQFHGSSERLHVVERISRMNDKALLYRFTVEDPSTWDRPWTGEYPWVATDDLIYRVRVPRGQLLARRRAARSASGRDADAGRWGPSAVGAGELRCSGLGSFGSRGGE